MREGGTMYENLTEPIDGIEMFPAPDTVFVPDQLHLARYLDPLVTIDLRLVDPAWDGVVHMLSPVEPDEGLIGEETPDTYTPLVRPNWMAFALEDTRMRFLADEQYFLLAALEAGTVEDDDDRLAALRTHYERQRASFDATAAHWREHGVLRPHSSRGHVEFALNRQILDQLGGFPGFGNWVETEPYPVQFGEELDDAAAESVARRWGVDPADVDDAVWPLSPSGRRFEFVAGVPGFNYRDVGADWILVFYQPEEHLALLTFDWS